MPATCAAGAPALRPTGPPCSLTPPHIPVRRLPASAGSFPTIPRMKAAHRESPRPEALELMLRYVGGGHAPDTQRLGSRSRLATLHTPVPEVASP